MQQRLNHLGQSIGDPVDSWNSVERPPQTVMHGQYCRVEPIDPVQHAASLFHAFSTDREERIWTYLPYGPFTNEDELNGWIQATCLGEDPFFHAIVDQSTGKAVGVASYLRIEPKAGVIEVGHINYSPLLQKTPLATEAMFLMMRRVFGELGYRRYEWKCDALNLGSRKAAERFGFQYEGIFRQATMYKGRNRDTAWYAIIDKDWPQLEKAFEAWLQPENFTTQGRQVTRLGELMS